MTTAATPRQPARTRTLSSRTLWVIAGDCAVAALALAQVLHGDTRLELVVALVVIAVLAGLGDVARRLSLAARSGALLRFVRTGAIVAVVLVATGLIYRSFGTEPVVIVLCLLAGMALMAHWLVGVIERSAVDETPWQQLGADDAGSGSGEPGSASWASSASNLPRWSALIVGAALLLFAIFDILAFGELQDRLSLYGARAIVVGVIAFAGLVGLIAGPLVLAAQAGVRRERKQRDRARERQAVAAHLHDSVLQTLALIQRSATDPERVVHLARTQERGLRTWLAGRDETAVTSLAEAIEGIVAEVEDESGVLIDSVIGGDLPMDDRTRALVAATREALRNAARHGAGAEVRVFLDVDATGSTVFVRDGGRGFDPGQVPEERRGVRDAIIGRMDHVGGTTTIDSSAAGTEVVLRLPFAEAGA